MAWRETKFDTAMALRRDLAINKVQNEFVAADQSGLAELELCKMVLTEVIDHHSAVLCLAMLDA